MTGLIGIIAFDKVWNVGRFIKYGLLALQHRGKEKIDIYIGDGVSLKKITIRGSDASRKLEDLELDRVKGWIGIGAISSTDSMESILISREGLQIAIIVDGHIRGMAREIGDRLMGKIGFKRDLPELFKEIITDHTGAFTLLMISNKGEMLAYRSYPGIKHLALGGYGFDLAIVSTETAPIEILGGEVKRSLYPGEAIYVAQDIFESIKTTNHTERTVCSFEYIYLARPDSEMDGVNIYEFRRELGELLGYRSRHKNIDIVVGIPDTAIPYAIGYSNATRKPIEYGFVATGQKIRTIATSDPRERIIGIQLKLNPIKKIYRDRNIALIDDSLVSGETLRNTIKIIRNKAGAREIHVVIGSPKIKYHCPYGVNLPNQENLLSSKATDDEARRYIEADTVTWLTTEDIEKHFKRYNLAPCLGCFTGKYPLKVG